MTPKLPVSVYETESANSPLYHVLDADKLRLARTDNKEHAEWIVSRINQKSEITQIQYNPDDPDGLRCALAIRESINKIFSDHPGANTEDALIALAWASAEWLCNSHGSTEVPIDSTEWFISRLLSALKTIDKKFNPKNRET